MNQLLHCLSKLKRIFYALIIARKLKRQPYFFHYTPDISGGVGTWIETCTVAFSEYKHFIVSNRGDRNPMALRLRCKPNVYLIGHLSYKEIILLFHILPGPVCVFNHIFWDLKPITKSLIKKDKVIVAALRHFQDSKLQCDPKEIDRVIVFTKSYEEIYRYKLPVELQLFVQPQCVNETEFVSVKPFRRNNSFVIGNITNGAPWKHSDDFIALCIEIQKVIPKAAFSFLGAKDLIEQTRDLKNFQIIPPFAAKTSEYLNSVSILIHKTRRDIKECAPRAIAEAMCAGIPVVAEAKGGIKDMILHEENGFLCQNNQDFINYCKLLYENEDLYWSISKKARLYAKANFSLAVFRGKIENLLREFETRGYHS
jgi:glycosyltransferase involved in cell wall biosynthesis